MREPDRYIMKKILHHRRDNVVAMYHSDIMDSGDGTIEIHLGGEEEVPKEDESEINRIRPDSNRSATVFNRD